MGIGPRGEEQGVRQGAGTEAEVEFARRGLPQPDGRVVVRIEVRQGGRLVGVIAQARGWWRWREVRRSVWGKEKWTSAEAARKSVKSLLEDDNSPTGK